MFGLVGVSVLWLMMAGIAGAQSLPDVPEVGREPHPVAPITQPYLAQPSARALFGADLAVRLLDAFTTSSLNDDRCNCYHEKELPQGLARSRVGMIAYSLSVSAGVEAGAALLYRHHHPKLARLAVLADIAGDGEAVIGNLKLRE